VGDGWLIKLNNSGTVLWQKRFGSKLDDQFFAIASAPWNGFVVTVSAGALKAM
jgi:hypothetical protein